MAATAGLKARVHPIVKSRRTRRAVIAAVVLAPIVLLAPVADDYVRAAGLLTRLTDPKSATWIASYRRHDVDVREGTFAVPNGELPARYYAPRGATEAPAMVVVHGVHHLGFNEPRLMAFAREIAASGVAVMTPHVPRLADFQVTPASIETIGAAATHLRNETGRPVCLFGLSFSGGLALIAAADHRYRNDVRCVIAVGAHHDMARVARFYATDETVRPDGSAVRAKAHNYGPLVLVYSHPEDFFPARDVPAARRVLRILLHSENIDAARAADDALSPAGRAVMDRVFREDRVYFTPKLLEHLERHSEEMAAVSPRGKLRGLTARVLLIHGSADDIIPPAETEWLAAEVPPGTLENLVITPLLSHVDVGSASRRDQAMAVHFIAEMLAAVE